MERGARIVRCAHCGEETTPKLSWTEHSGWAKPRRSGGVNALTARRATGRVLCPACGARLAEGFLRPEGIGTDSPEQERML